MSARSAAIRGRLKQEKPPFSLMTMSDIEAIEWNDFNVVSTFSGAGGSCLGYRMSGFRVLWANEFVKAAREVYKLNHPKSVVDDRDIRTIEPDEITKAVGIDGRDIDLLDGSPPCASFSTSGQINDGWNAEKTYSDKKQRVDDLFFEFVRILNGLQPKTFIAENVRGLVTGRSKGYFKEILKSLKDCGYNVKVRTIEANLLGVPQTRKRVIFLGVRDDLGLDPVHPSPLKYRYTMRDALPYIKYVKFAGGAYNWKSTGINACPTITQAMSSPTGQFSGGNYVAEKIIQEYRRLTIDELKILQTFPHDFKLIGSFKQQWERLGRAVPPLMMMHISKAMRDNVLCKL